MQREPPPDPTKLEKALSLITEANSKDPSRVDVDGEKMPYRVVYAKWLSDWVKQVDPKASDELLIYTHGKSLESWKLSEIRRDDYAPNAPGQKQWEQDRKQWQAARLTAVMKEAGYPDSSVQLIEDIMLNKGVPDPRDMRKFDLVGPFGMINYRLLEQAKILQTVYDAEALLFLERTFPQMFAQLPADEVGVVLKRELSRLSERGIMKALSMPWKTLERKLVMKALPTPKRFNNLMMDAEGLAAASTHPGDWRYQNFDYE